MTIAMPDAQHFGRRAPPRRLADPRRVYDRCLVARRRRVPTAVDAERAFARDAQRIGQWTAFRKYADQDAVMFTPQAVWVRDFSRAARIRPRR